MLIPNWLNLLAKLPTKLEPIKYWADDTFKRARIYLDIDKILTKSSYIIQDKHWIFIIINFFIHVSLVIWFVNEHFWANRILQHIPYFFLDMTTEWIKAMLVRLRTWPITSFNLVNQPLNGLCLGITWCVLLSLIKVHYTLFQELLKISILDAYFDSLHIHCLNSSFFATSNLKYNLPIFL